MPFISSSKLCSFWRYLSFCSDFSGHVGKRLDKKAKINFKIDDVANWETNYYNTHSAQYLKIKNNQENKFVQLIEYNLRNNFAEKSYPKCDGETSLRHFKNSVSLDKVLYSLFLSCAHFETYRNILKLSADHLLLLYIRLFKKQQVV